MIQDLFIIGATGKVGKTLVRQIFEKGDTDRKKHPNPTRIVGLASSSNVLYSPKGLSKDESTEFTEMKNKKTKYNELNEFLDIVENSIRREKTSLVFVDTTPINKPMTEFHLQVIEKTPYAIVTANKNPIALSPYSTFKRLTHDVKRYGYRCSVMAGAHAVPLLQELRDVNDLPLLLQGCFSGTLGYITSELEKGKKFSAILKDAYAKGYTEPHPRDDLNGLDVARKLIVLARTAGFEVDIKDIELEPFIPDKFFAEDSVDKFMKSVESLDEEFTKKISSALEKNNTLRYVASMDARNG